MRVSVPAPEPVPDAIVAISAFASWSIVIVCPTAKPPRFATLMLVAPLWSPQWKPSAPPRKTCAVLFSSTVFATPTLPTSQPARANGTHGAGALRTAPVPPSDGGSLLTML